MLTWHCWEESKIKSFLQQLGWKDVTDVWFGQQNPTLDILVIFHDCVIDKHPWVPQQCSLSHHFRTKELLLRFANMCDVHMRIIMHLAGFLIVPAGFNEVTFLIRLCQSPLADAAPSLAGTKALLKSFISTTIWIQICTKTFQLGLLFLSCLTNKRDWKIQRSQ